MTCDERIEALLNRAGQTISDLPKGDGKHLIYDKELRKGADVAQRAWHGIGEGYVDIVDDLYMHQDYILHLTDVIDRMEAALDNALNLHDHNAHIVVNTNPPEGVTREQFNAVVDAIYDSWEKARAGLEPWEDDDDGL